MRVRAKQISTVRVWPGGPDGLPKSDEDAELVLSAWVTAGENHINPFCLTLERSRTDRGRSEARNLLLVATRIANAAGMTTAEFLEFWREPNRPIHGNGRDDSGIELRQAGAGSPGTSGGNY